MSDDLVKRLRKLAAWSVLPAYASYGEAADEIERLRAELAAEREQVWKAHAANLSLAEDNDALRALLREARVIVADEDRPRMDASELTARIDALLNKGGGDE